MSMQRTGPSPRTASLGGAPLKRLAFGFGIGGLLVLVTIAGKLYLSPSKPPATTAVSQKTTASVPENDAESLSLPSLMDGLDGALLADGVTPEPISKASSAKSSGKSPLSSEDTTSPMELAITLMITIAGIVGVVWIIAKLLRSTRLAPGNQRVLKMVDSLPLGAKRHVWVVGFRDRTLILGGGGEDVRLLAEYSDDEWAEHAQVIDADEASVLSSAAPESIKSEPVQKSAVFAEDRATPASPSRHHAPHIAIEEPAVTFQLSAQAKAKAASAQPAKKKTPSRDSQTSQKAQKRLPPGAHRVPAAFRHLLEEPGVMDESAS